MDLLVLEEMRICFLKQQRQDSAAQPVLPDSACRRRRSPLSSPLLPAVCAPDFTGYKAVRRGCRLERLSSSHRMRRRMMKPLS
ncbi:hypothetical protein AMECASPLE_030716 [Ameca splendens]|uniref:Uncharacterized protein n=1 Tax=Ameca splendens TaxID=208324 RepID=A0ABV0YHV3_9TELE